MRIRLDPKIWDPVHPYLVVGSAEVWMVPGQLPAMAGVDSASGQDF